MAACAPHGPLGSCAPSARAKKGGGDHRSKAAEPLAWCAGLCHPAPLEGFLKGTSRAFCGQLQELAVCCQLHATEQMLFTF